MSDFNTIFQSLRKGAGVRREYWAPEVRIFVENNALMYHSGIQKPWRCALSWEEIAATDWMLLNAVPFEQGADGMTLVRSRDKSIFDLSDSPFSNLSLQDISELRTRLHSDPEVIRKKGRFDS